MSVLAFSARRMTPASAPGMMARAEAYQASLNDT